MFLFSFSWLLALSFLGSHRAEGIRGEEWSCYALLVDFYRSSDPQFEDLRLGWEA